MMIESYIGGFYLKDEKGNVVGETHPGCKELIFQFLENHGYKPSDSADVWIREKIDNSSILPEQSKKSMITFGKE